MCWMPLYATNTVTEVILEFTLRNPIPELADGERYPWSPHRTLRHLYNPSRMNNLQEAL